MTLVGFVSNKTKTEHNPVNLTQPPFCFPSTLLTLTTYAPFVARTIVTSNFRG